MVILLGTRDKLMGGICRGDNICSCLVREPVGLVWFEEDTLDCRIWISVQWVLYIENRSRHHGQLTVIVLGDSGIGVGRGTGFTILESVGVHDISASLLFATCRSRSLHPTSLTTLKASYLLINHAILV
jgi:hypothetical protein